MYPPPPANSSCPVPFPLSLSLCLNATPGPPLPLTHWHHILEHRPFLALKARWPVLATAPFLVCSYGPADIPGDQHKVSGPPERALCASFLIQPSSLTRD